MFIMEGMGKNPRRPRRAFTPEFKAEIVEARRRGDRSGAQVARDFDVTETARPSNPGLRLIGEDERISIGWGGRGTGRRVDHDRG
jgi:hypothetical protein